MTLKELRIDLSMPKLDFVLAFVYMRDGLCFPASLHKDHLTLMTSFRDNAVKLEIIDFCWGVKKSARERC